MNSYKTPAEHKSGDAVPLDKSLVRVLAADDELGMRDLLSAELGSQGYQVVTASNGEEAMRHIQERKFDLVITDLKMPQMDGIALLENIKRFNPELEVIIATGHGTIEDAVTAMKEGAYDFILKPFNLDELNAMVEKALEKKKLKALVALYEASNAVFSTIELDRLLEVILDMVQVVLGSEECSLMLLNEQRKLVIAASRGLSNGIAQEVQLEIGERVAGIVAKEKRARLIINGLEKYPEFKGMKSNPRIQSSIICPLLSQGELLGVLNINRTKAGNNFTTSDLQSVSIFASQAALAIQNAKLYRNLQRAYQKIETTQGQLIQSEKLASIGRLVAGVAHELNNPLTAVIGYSQLISESQNLAEIQKQIPIIFSQAKRCSSIVKDLLLFARRQQPQYLQMNPCLLMDEIIQGMSLGLEKKKITVEKKFPKNSISIQGDPHQLKQVFSNLLTNASQALEEVTKNREIEILVKIAGENIVFSFKDNGPGIPKEIIHKVFDPFYTTKGVGKGTGLGLSLCYGIIKAHRGTIYAESIQGKETTFVVEIPLKVQEEDMPTVSERPKDSVLKLQAGSRVLLAEDEEPIRGLITRIFHGQSYHLDVAVDGQVALEMIKRQDYDIVLCDYRMPKLDGIELYEQVAKLNPKLAKRFLFITGSTEFMRNFDSFFKRHRLPCLLKPFTKDEMISAINSTIGINQSEAGDRSQD